MGYFTLLHDPHCEASRMFMASWGDLGPVLTGNDAHVYYGNFRGYPTVIYVDDKGEKHALFSPADQAAVESWRAGIDNSKGAAESVAQEASPFDFALRFTSDERKAIRAMAKTNPDVEDFWDLARIAKMESFNHPIMSAGLALLVESGLLTQDRATQIGTP